MASPYIYETNIHLPTMVGCTLQKYENSPGCMNLCENDLDGIISAVKPESNNSPALTVLGSPDVRICTNVYPN